jgi:hypothetical protein
MIVIVAFWVWLVGFVTSEVAMLYIVGGNLTHPWGYRALGTVVALFWPLFAWCYLYAAVFSEMRNAKCLSKGGES